LWKVHGGVYGYKHAVFNDVFDVSELEDIEFLCKYVCSSEIHEKNSRVHLDKLQNKCTNCKGVKNKHQFWTNYWNTREAGYNMQIEYLEIDYPA